MSLNKVMLIGYLGADPETRRLNNGDSVVNMRVATSERWKDKSSGERKEKTDWHNVVVFNQNLVQVAEKWLRKGSKVYIEGKLQTRSWEDRVGTKKYTTEIVLAAFNGTIEMLDGKGDGEGERSGGRRDDRGDDRGSGARGGERERKPRNDLDDQIPF